MDNTKKKCLVVDDNTNLVTVLVDKFNSSGFETEGAYDGEEGLKKALESHPDVILLDLVMPKVDGLGMLKELRRDNWGRTAKVMILTLMDDPGYVANAMDSNILGYVVKTDLSLDGIVRQVKVALKME